MRGERGSILLILLVFLTVLIIAMAAAAPRLAQQVRRDRETEMIHRGEQYARAIKRFYQKTGAYPVRIEQLENTNNVRFLRKRYADPMSPDGNWKLLHYGDLMQLGGTGGLGSVQPSGQQPQSLLGGAQQGNQQQPSAFGQPSSFGQGSQASSFGQNSQPSAFGQNAQPSSFGAAQQNTGTAQGGIFGSSLTGQQFGGGPIIGVASTSEKPGIHEFNNKKKYNQWLFVYDPMQDIPGVLIKGPYNPQKTAGVANPGIGTPAGGLTGQPVSNQPQMPNIPGNPFGGQQNPPTQDLPNR